MKDSWTVVGYREVNPGCLLGKLVPRSLRPIDEIISRNGIYPTRVSAEEAVPRWEESYRKAGDNETQVKVVRR
ncbi:hypothetical protein JXA63_03975 [Candidatus Woesebacteria bacterium]|nr:hypothetical protein [Candidatus Woesebacteria bacterium]